MDPNFIAEITKEAIFVLIKVSAPILAVSLGVGLVISLIQALTQIQEATLSFVPKLLAILFTLLLTANYILAKLSEFFIMLIGRI